MTRVPEDSPALSSPSPVESQEENAAHEEEEKASSQTSAAGNIDAKETVPDTKLPSPNSNTSSSPVSYTHLFSAWLLIEFYDMEIL